jgi:rare lipoprotein A
MPSAPAKAPTKSPLQTYPSIGEYQIGIASWYGNEEHGRQSASGFRFNKYEHTAAHRTLPLDTLVRVKNLENGKDVIVKINDRGPFIPGRIIDLSYAAAKSIDMIDKGTARVKVEVIALPRETPDPFIPKFTIQLGAFKDKSRAFGLKDGVKSEVSHEVRVEPFDYYGDTLYRVRVGRFERKQDAERLAYELGGKGYTCRVIQE